jgi:ectoine hydroxylase-related dioxygenase (phytanoyl-CoA dioxygenase family)
MSSSAVSPGNIQSDTFTNDGYLIVPQAIAPPLLERLRQQFDELMYHGDEILVTSNTINGKTYVNALDKLLHRGNLAALELLGAPFILDIAASICGPDFFLIQEFGVIKMLGDTVPVLWHQDMVHQRTGRCFTMGIYLDDANAGDGALKVVPQSHTSGKDICTLMHQPAVEVPVKAGDILIHDMMLAHSSEPMRHNAIRRVLYFEFLSVKQVLHENIYSEALLHNRIQLLHLAIEYYRSLHPQQVLFEWHNPFPDVLPPQGDFAEALEAVCSINVQAVPSAYCFEGLQFV